MPNQEQDASQDKPLKSIEEIPPTVENPPSDTIGDENKAKDETTITKTEPAKFKEIELPQESKSDREAVRANKIAIWQLIVNAFLLGGTLAALYFTYKSVAITNEALVYAKYKDRISDSTDSIKFERTFDLSKRSLDSNTNANNNSFQLQKQSVASQIKSIADVENRFKTEGQPLLQIINISINTDSVNGKVTGEFYIANLGKFAATIDSGYWNFGFFFEKATLKEIDKYKNDAHPIAANYIAANLNAQQITFSTPVSETGISLLKRSLYSCFLKGQITYTDVVTKSSFIYSFVIKIEIAPLFNVTPLKRDYIKIK